MPTLLRLMPGNRSARGMYITLVMVLYSVSSAGQPPAAFALPVNVTIDTTALLNSNAFLAFDFFDGDGINNNTATILNFVTDGTLGAAATTGDVSGTLPSPVAISDMIGFGELLQTVTLGTWVSFTLDLTTNFVGAPADNFAVFLLDPATSFSLVDSKLPGDALLTATITGPQSLALAVSSVNVPAVLVSASNAVVPEPSTFMLMALGLTALVWHAHRRHSF